jgi:hypothetical protein
MAIATASLVYGIPLHTKEDPWARLPTILGDILELDKREMPEGFIRPYCGNDQSYAFGMDMNIGISAGDLFTDASELNFNVTDAEKRYFQSIFDKLSPEVQAAVHQFGEPRVFLLWGTT